MKKPIENFSEFSNQDIYLNESAKVNRLLSKISQGKGYFDEMSDIFNDLSKMSVDRVEKTSHPYSFMILFKDDAGIDDFIEKHQNSRYC